jgi:indole-3-glycerol phosphate synthase
MNVLDQILTAKLQEIEDLRPRSRELRSKAEQAGTARSFGAAMRAGRHIALIAEFKRRSPSAGWIRQTALVVEYIKAYSDCGARAISVLTDEKFFGGSLSDLSTAHVHSRVPLLRKDFVLEEVQLFEARASGADAVLLIVRALDDERMTDLLTTARGIGLDVLVETHSGEEIERALRAGADIIGINNRDLANFSVDFTLTTRLLEQMPPDVITVAESGVRTVNDVEQLAAAGIDAVLIGETLMRADDVCATVAAFATQPRRSR